MSQQVPADLMRAVIREVLHEVIAGEVGAAVAQARPTGTATAAGGEVVSITTQAELDAAIRRILADAIHPARRAALQSGKVRFVLGSSADRPSAARPEAALPSSHRFERGALTERHVRAAAQAGVSIVITGRVVVTPLAKDRARAMGVTIVKED